MELDDPEARLTMSDAETAQLLADLDEWFAVQSEQPKPPLDDGALCRDREQPKGPDEEPDRVDASSVLGVTSATLADAVDLHNARDVPDGHRSEMSPSIAGDLVIAPATTSNDRDGPSPVCTP